MPSPESKVVKFRGSDHTTLEHLRLRVIEKSGVSRLTLPQLVMMMAKSYEENELKK